MYIKLFLSFIYIGTFTFGGGYAMLPMFQRILVEKHNWLEEKEMTEIFSVGQCLPGVIATNTAVIVGHKQKGILGSAVAVLGLALPSIVMILIIANLINNFAHIPAVQSAFLGLRICVSVLILNTVVKLWKNSIVDKTATIIFAVVFLIAVFTNVPIALLVIASGISAIVISNFRKSKSASGGTK